MSVSALRVGGGFVGREGGDPVPVSVSVSKEASAWWVACICMFRNASRRGLTWEESNEEAVQKCPLVNVQ